MKEGIHPKYGPSEMQCACGSKVVTRSTKSLLKVDICNQCHPFFTGKHKFIDTAGRIEKFNRKYGKPQMDGHAETASEATSESK